MSALKTVPGLEIPEARFVTQANRNVIVTVSLADLPPVISGTEFLQQDLVLPDELVAGLIHRGTQTLFAGGSKSYKTWIQLHLGVCVATGTKFWERETTPGRVLYMNFEMGPPFFQKRIREVCRLLTGSHEVIDMLDVWNLRGNCSDIKGLLPAILEQCALREYSLVILDPIYKILGGRNENAAGEMADFLNQLDSLCVKTGAAVVFGHHFAKGSAAGKEQIDRASGSGVFARHPDGIITLTKHVEESAFVVEATLRNFRQVKPFGVRWDYPFMQPDHTLDPKQLKQIGGRPAKHNRADIVAVLQAGMTKSDWCIAAHDATGVCRSSFYPLATEAARKGEVEETAGKWSRCIKEAVLSENHQ